MMTDLDSNTHDNADQASIARRNRIQMIGIMMIGFLTLATSYAVFYFAKSGGGWGTTNNGEFVTPLTTTAQLGWQVQGARDRWWLWTVTSSTCNTPCQDQMHKLQAVHKLLNRDVDRVRRGYTGPQGAWMNGLPTLAPVTISTAQAVKDGIYIVDPNGNLVLYYPLNAEPKPVLEDLKKLLKVSQIG